MVRAAGTRGYTQTHTSHKCTHSTSQTVRQLSSHQLLSQPVSHPNKQSTHLSLQSTKQLSNKPSIQPVTCRRDEGQPYWYTSLRHRRHTGLQRFCNTDMEGIRVRDTYRVWSYISASGRQSNGRDRGGCYRGSKKRGSLIETWGKEV